jgi:uncharacterized protein
MLIEFRFKNFLSFRDDCVFSMVASKDTSLPDNVLPASGRSGQRLLRSAVVYGANAAGKSNLTKAFGFVNSMVRHSAERGGVTRDGKLMPFLLDDASSREPSEFELTFIEQGIRYQYGFALDGEKVCEEWLFAFPKGQPQKWFVRALNEKGEPEWDWGSHLLGEKTRLAGMTRSDALFLSVAAQFNQTQLQPVYNWFAKRLQTVKAQALPNIFTLDRLDEDADFKAQVEKLLQIADLGISRIVVETDALKAGSIEERIAGQITLLLEKGAASEKSDTGPVLELDLRRPSFYHSVSPREDKRLEYDFESEGTKRVFELAVAFIDTLEMGLVLVVDELDSSLHPLLTRKMVEFFHNPELNKNNAQLIFNTHDTTLLDSRLFRRDQVWFAEKDEAGASKLYSLLEFRPRKSEALEKGYLQGRYGAVPFLGSQSDFLVGEEA